MTTLESITFNKEEYKELEISKHKFIDCEFNECIFDTINFIDTSFINCTFNKCELSNLRSTRSDFKNISILNSKIYVIDFNSFLPKGKIANIFNVLQNNEFIYSNFIKLNLNKFDFRTNNIIRSTFEECNLSESNFSNTILEGSNFISCNLTKTNFLNAHDYTIDINSCILKGGKYSYPEVISLLNSLELIIE